MIAGVMRRKARSLVVRMCGRMASTARILKFRLLYPAARIPWSVAIGSQAIVRATDGGSIVIGAGTEIGPCVQLVAQGGALRIGAGGFIGQGCVIVSHAAVAIGDDALIAEYVTIRDQDHRFPAGGKIRESGFSCAPVSIGADVWIGTKASVLKGASIGDGAVVGAHSLVKGAVAAGAVVAGVPARQTASRPGAERGDD